MSLYLERGYPDAVTEVVRAGFKLSRGMMVAEETPAPPVTGLRTLTLMGVGGFITPGAAFGAAAAAAAGQLIRENPIVTRRKVITGGGSGD